MITRRLFGSLLAGVTAARAVTVDFVQHRILRRPHSWEHVIDAQPYWLYDCLFVTAFSKAPLRITARAEGDDESMLEITAVPRPSDTFMLRGVHRARAEKPVTIRVESKKPFSVAIEPKFMRPDFKRVQNAQGVMMLEFYDPFYKNIPEDLSRFGQGQPHHRILGGPAKDINYRASFTPPV
jgi:hypothetical protein